MERSENSFKSQEQKTTHELSIVKIAEAENKERKLYRPITLGKGGNNINKAVLDGDAGILANGQKCQKYIFEPDRDRTEEHLEIVKECFKLAEF